MFIHPTSQRTAWNEKTCYTKESFQITGLILKLIFLGSKPLTLSHHESELVNQKSVNFHFLTSIWNPLIASSLAGMGTRCLLGHTLNDFPLFTAKSECLYQSVVGQ